MGPKIRCEVCNKVVRKIRENHRFCSSKCRLIQWDKDNPRVKKGDNKMKLLFASLILCASLKAQTAIYNNFSPTVQGITVGNYHCYFWFHDVVPTPYDYEIACYGYDTPVIIVGPKEIPTPFTSFKFPGGYIGWILKLNDDRSISLQLSGMGPNDIKELLINTTI